MGPSQTLENESWLPPFESQSTLFCFLAIAEAANGGDAGQIAKRLDPA